MLKGLSFAKYLKRRLVGVLLFYSFVIVVRLLAKFFDVSSLELEALLTALCAGLYLLCDAVISYLRTQLKGYSLMSLFCSLALLVFCVVGLMELDGLIHLPPKWGVLAVLLFPIFHYPVLHYYQQDRAQHQDKYEMIEERSLLDRVLLRFPDLRHFSNEQESDLSEDN